MRGSMASRDSEKIREILDDVQTQAEATRREAEEIARKARDTARLIEELLAESGEGELDGASPETLGTSSHRMGITGDDAPSLPPDRSPRGTSR